MPHPVLTRTGAEDWPANDNTIYDRSTSECEAAHSDQACTMHVQPRAFRRSQADIS